METAVVDMTLGMVSATAVPINILGLVGAVALLMVAGLASVLVLRLFYEPFRRSEPGAQTQLLYIALANVLSLTAAFIVGQLAALPETVDEVWKAIRANIVFLVAVVAVGVVALLWWALHAPLLGAALELNQCEVRPVLDPLVFRLLNVARALYNLVWPPFVNTVYEIYSFLIWGSFKLTVACATRDGLADVLVTVGRALGLALDAAAQWLINGLFNNERLHLVPALRLLGQGVGNLRPLLLCVCRDLYPVFDALLGFVQLPTLHVALECAANVPVRAVSMGLTVLITFQPPRFGNLTREAQCVVTGYGDVIEDTVVLVLEALYEIFSIIGALLSTAASARTALAGVAVTPASSHSRLVAAWRHAAGATTAARHLPRLRVSGRGATTPAAAGSGSGSVTAAITGDEALAALWALLRGIDLVALYGLEALLRLASAPWTHWQSEPVAVVLGVLNMTAEAVFHPVEAFGSGAAGIAYFQIGHLGDRLRIGVSVLAEFLVLIDPTLPCLFGTWLRAAVFLVEGALELFVAWAFAIVHRPWLPGPPCARDDADLWYSPAVTNCTLFNNTNSSTGAPIVPFLPLGVYETNCTTRALIWSPVTPPANCSDANATATGLCTNDDGLWIRQRSSKCAGGGAVGSAPPCAIDPVPVWHLPAAFVCDNTTGCTQRAPVWTVTPPVNCTNVTPPNCTNADGTWLRTLPSDCADPVVPVPPGWSPFDSIVAYGDWNASALQSAIRELRGGGECAAVLFGCDTPALNAPPTAPAACTACAADGDCGDGALGLANCTRCTQCFNGARVRGGACTLCAACDSNRTSCTSCTLCAEQRSDCVEAPAGCLARSLVHLGTESLNQTTRFLTYVPDFLRFNGLGGYHTPLDIDLERIVAAERALVACLTGWLDSLDPDAGAEGACLTTDVPTTLPPPRTNGTLPADDGSAGQGIDGAATRDLLHCERDGQAYTLDGRLVLVRTGSPTDATATIIDRPMACDPRASRGCVIATSAPESLYAIEVVGSAPTDANTTLRVAPRNTTAAPWQWLPLTLTLSRNASVGLYPLPDAATLLGRHNVASATVDNCTRDLMSEQFTDPVPAALACMRNGTGVSLALVNTSAPTRRGTQLFRDAAATQPLPCTLELDELVIGCALGQLVYRGRPVYKSLPGLLGTEAGETPSRCSVAADDIVVAPPLVPGLWDTVCYTNRLATFLALPSERVRNDTGVFYHYYTDAVTGARRTVPCASNWAPQVQTTTTVPPATTVTAQALVCDAATRTLSSVETVATTLVGGGNTTTTVTTRAVVALTVAGTTAPEPCVPTPLTAPPPVSCFSVAIIYINSGVPVHVRFEGGNVRVSSGTAFRPEPLPCLYYAPVATAAAAAPAGVSPSTAAGGARSLRQMMAAARTRIAREEARTHSRLAATEDTTRGSVLFAALGSVDKVLRAAAGPAVYRRQSALCCFSAVVGATGEYAISLVAEILYTVRALAALAAFPPLTGGIFHMPTFEEARDNLQAALCHLACLVTSVIPDTLECTALRASTSCGTLAACAANVLCAVSTAVLTLVTILVDVLRMVRALVDGEAPPVSVLGDACNADTVGQCLVSVLVYLVTRVLFAATNVARALAGFGDCLLCALSRLSAPNYACPAILTATVGALADLIDGIGATLLTAVLNFVVGVISCIVYFFSGQFDKLANTFVSQVLGSIGGFFVNIGNLIWKFITELPGIGPFIRVLLDIVRTSCETLSDAIVFFGGNALTCDNINKRHALEGAAAASGTLLAGVSARATAVWSGAAAVACRGASVRLNASGTALAPADVEELLFCLAAHLWVGPDADPLDDRSGLGTCDLLMPELYAGARPYAALGALERASAVPCAVARLKAERLRGLEAAWVPRDFFFDGVGVARVLQLADEAAFAYGIWHQMASDRDAPADAVGSAAYAAAWEARGYAATPAAAAPTAAAYVDRTLAAAAAGRGPRGNVAPRYSAARLTRLVEGLWEPILGGANASRPSLPGYVASALLAQLDASADAVVPSVALTRSLFDDLAAANDSRLLTQTVGGLVGVFTHALPATLARVARSPAVAAQVAAARQAPAAMWRAASSVVNLAAMAVGGSGGGGGGAIDTAAGVAVLVARAAANTPAAAAAVGGSLAAGMGRLITAARGTPHGMGTFLGRVLWGAATVRSSADAPRLAAGDALIDQLGAAPHHRRARLMQLGAATQASWALVARADLAGAAANGSTTALPECRFDAVLCDHCHYLDWLFAMLRHAVGTAIQYLGSTAPAPAPALNRSMAAYQAFEAYASDPEAYVVLGDSPELPARWPWRDYDNVRILGDPTPDKLRFTDVAVLWERTWALVRGTAESPDSAAGGGALLNFTALLAAEASPASTTAAAGTRRPGASMTSVFARAVDAAAAAYAPAAAPANGTARQQRTAAVSAKTAAAVAAAGFDFGTALDVAVQWATFLFRWTLSCSFEEELTGANKRFSIGETVGLVLLAAILVTLLLRAIVIGDTVLSLAGGVTFFFGFLFFGLLIVTYNWSLLCSPALPAPLADDLMYFGMHTAAPKCSPLGGLVNEADYNNTNCYACDGWRRNTPGQRWTIPSFTQDARFGFVDVSYNLVFTLRTSFPDALAWLQTTGKQSPILGSLLSVPFVAARLHAYDDFNQTTTDRVTYSQIFLGWFVTMLCNVPIAIALVVLLALLWPLLKRIVGALAGVLAIAFMMLLAGLAAPWVLGDAAFAQAPPPSPVAANSAAKARIAGLALLPL